MATLDPYQNWSGAPKHWVEVPAQRTCPPTPDQLDDATRRWPDPRDSHSRGEWSVVAVAVAVAVAAFVLVGTGSATTEQDPSPANRTIGTSVR